MKFNFSILNENGEEIIINTLQDLPILTTGLLEVNLIKILKRYKENKELHDQSIGVGIVYLYFLKRAFGNGALSDQTLEYLKKLFRIFLKMGSLNNIEFEDYNNTFDESKLKQKLSCLSKIKDFYKTISEQEKEIIFNLWKQFYHRMLEELTEDLKTPIPNYFLNTDFLNSDFKYLAKLTKINSYNNWVLTRESNMEVRHYFRNAIQVIVKFLSKKHIESGEVFSFHENHIQKHLKN